MECYEIKIRVNKMVYYFREDEYVKRVNQFENKYVVGSVGKYK